MAAKTKVNPMNGMHTAGIFSDMSVDGPVIGTLVLIVDRAKNLPNRKTIGKQDPYCAARLGKEARKTTTDVRGGQTPKWDQELRFPVHDSPDYYQLKLSVFNDDKRTELIGETWIDLRDIILPGGGQSDHWHTLSCKGKYAGEIRIETTYYDTRPKPEKPAAKPKPVASAPELDGGNAASRTPVKRRPLPTNPGNPGSTEPSPAAKPRAAPVQTPPRQQPHAHGSFIPNQSPLQAVEYGTPPAARFSQAEEHGSRYAMPPSHRDAQYRQSVDRGDKFIALEEDRRYTQEPYPRAVEHDHRSSLPASQPDFDAPSPAVIGPRQLGGPQQDGERPPPPPAHRVRNNTAPPHEMSVPAQHKATPPLSMRHDVLRNEAHRHSVQAVPSPSSTSTYPGRPTYRPYDSAPEMPKQLTYEDASHQSPPRHHSYDAAVDPHPRSMQPTVEDVPESWTPPTARVRGASFQQDHYEEGGYGSVPSPAPLNLSGRSSAVSGHYTTPSPVERHYGTNTFTASPSPVASRDHYDDRAGRSYGQSYEANMDPYLSNGNVPEGTLVHRSTDYGVPPVPPTLIPGVDPTLSQEIANRINEDRRYERRYTQPAAAVTPTRGRQHSEPPAGYGQPSPQNHYYQESNGYGAAYSNGPNAAMRGHSPGAAPHAVRDRSPAPAPYAMRDRSPAPAPYTMRDRSPAPAPYTSMRGHSPGPNPNHTIKRKSVSPAPPQDGRRLSGVPFGPDSYDDLNPSVAAVKDETKNGEYTNAYGKIVTVDGREVDPSDHLPMDTWAPEPEPKGPKQIEAAPSTRPMPSGAQPMPPSGRRQIRITARPQSMAVVPSAYTAPDVEPLSAPSSGRNRLQKKNQRMAALPAPAPIPGPLAPASSQQRNSTPPMALVRAGTFDYENYGPPYGTPRGAYGSGPPIPAKVPLMSGGLGPSSGGGGGEWALMDEMSRIDIGSGRSRRHGGY
ncbi:hypothetical protein BKA67DRAFT_591954 [Truncatella angustata]|uniref:C2 domain-containing protein n=1 Tax=Truncatella angustata TaxID=152316 RepID=A0A9P8UN37_9PEZI|nr:uncharacterized protein BKA67DRAFT_591954 [Truncatella angustata]KAH6655724.1 hypothetical protein BKA67DRAFT_591954 [Truncatella angustata]